MQERKNSPVQNHDYSNPRLLLHSSSRAPEGMVMARYSKASSELSRAESAQSNIFITGKTKVVGSLLISASTGEIYCHLSVVTSHGVFPNLYRYSSMQGKIQPKARTILGARPRHQQTSATSAHPGEDVALPLRNCSLRPKELKREVQGVFFEGVVQTGA